MTTTYKRIIIAAIAFILIAIAASAFVVTGGCSSSTSSSKSSDPIETMRNDAMNTLIDTSGIKDRLETELHAHSGQIAERTGLPQTAIDTAIDSLDIQEWEVTSLPADAKEAGTVAIDTDEVTANVTTYDDPSIVTVDAYGQTLTLSVPDSAQTYVSLLNYLN